MKTSQVLPRSRITVSAVTPEQVADQIEYIKEAVTNFSVPLSDIKGPRDSGNSYDILWVMPGFGTTSGTKGNNQSDVLLEGVLCDVRRSTYKIENLSPFTLYLRLQRPMGYKGAPTALGMWEPAVHGKDSLLIPIKPHQTKTFHFNNSSTGLMCPRQEMRQGKACIHLATLALSKEPLSDFGSVIAPKDLQSQDAVNITVVTQYRANDGSIGKVGEYGIVSYAGTQRMNEINTGPPPIVRVCDMRLQGGNAEFAYVDKAHTKELIIMFVNQAGEQKQECDGLDKQTIYELPIAYPGKFPGDKVDRWARFIRWNEADPAYTKNAWIVCDLYYDFNAHQMRYKYITVADNQYPGVPGMSDPILPGGTILRPTASTSFAVKIRPYTSKIKTRVNATVHQARHYSGLSDLEDGILDVFLTAIVVIVKVVKVGVEIAGMIGVLAIDPPEHAFMVATGSSA